MKVTALNDVKMRMNMGMNEEGIDRFKKLNIMVNTLRPEQNGRHFADKIKNVFSTMKIIALRFKFHKSLLLMI